MQNMALWHHWIAIFVGISILTHDIYAAGQSVCQGASCLGSDIAVHCPNRILLESITFKADCERDGLTVSCDDPIAPGTLARITCQKQYEKPKNGYVDTLICNENAKWDKTPKECIPICGEIVSRNTPLVNPKVLTFVPWMTAIYNNYHKFICAGTLLSAKAVLTAPVCFWDPLTGVFRDKKFFFIAAGKLFGEFFTNDPIAQVRDIAYFVQPNREHFQVKAYAADIVVAILEKPFRLMIRIAPICMGWNIEKSIVGYDFIFGAVPYFSRVESYPDNFVARIIVDSHEKCIVHAGPLAADKLCTSRGYWITNSYITTGSGVIHPWYLRGGLKYVLKSVVSTGIASINMVTLTNVSYHKTFLDKFTGIEKS